MDFWAIVGFIIIAYISSLSNKDKKGTQSKSRPSTNKSKPSKLSSANRLPSNNENRRKGLTSGLEDLFKEMKAEFEKTFEEVQNKQNYPSIKQSSKKENSTKKENSVKTKPKIEEQKGIPIKNTKNLESIIYEGEIGREKAYIKFNKKSIIQGVIMSEILQKPKSLRR